MKKVIGIGNALVDVMTSLKDDEVLTRLAFPKGSMQLVDGVLSNSIKEETKEFVVSLKSGGSAANTIHGLAMLGVETGFIGSVGRDETGDIFENDMREAGVEVHLQRRDQHTGTAVAMITPDTERTFATHLGAAVEMNADDLVPEVFSGYDFLYLEGYLITNIDLVRTACRIAKDKGMKVVIDLASFNVVSSFINEFKEIVSEFVDILFANEEEARAYTGKEPGQALLELAQLCDLAVVKIGKEGSLIKRGDEEIRVKSIEVTSLDTTGAGDLYAAGFLYGLVNNAPLHVCGAYGTLLAGNVIEIVGPKIGKKRWNVIKREIENIQAR